MSLYEAYGLFIDGQWRAAADGQTRPVTDPATEEVLGAIPMAGSDDLDRALASAAAGFELWRRVGPWDRAAKLRLVADHLRARLPELARIMSAETGKPIGEALGEWRAAADQFEWYGEEAKRIYGQVLDGRTPGVRLDVIYQPVGVVAAFSAWNFPALLPARKIAAALAAGCSIIIKPAGETPGSCMAIVEACRQAEFPAGAVNLVTGASQDISEHLVRSPIVRKVSLTGSIPVGRQILRLAAEGIKKVSMELGGHAPVLVFEDCDVERAAETCATFKFRNAGQVCISPSRFFVQEGAYPAFAEGFVRAVRRIKVGPPSDETSTMGPLATRRGLTAANELIADAVARGAELLHGGQAPGGFNRGYYLEPTVLGRVPDEARIMNEEPFAPIAPLTTFRTLEEGLAQANALPFGLAGYIFSRDLATAQRAAAGLEVGMVGVNDMMLATAEAPFGGVKESGIGREGGSLGLFDYLEAKYIKTNYAPQ